MINPLSQSHFPNTVLMELNGLKATEALARDLAPLLIPGDFITLGGDLGAGKTAFARALLRVLADDPELEVPSPTFTLIQMYDTPVMPVVHADLYRIKDQSELEELGWEEAGPDSLLLIEWPDRLGDFLPADRLELSFSLSARNPDARQVAMRGYGRWAERLGRHVAVQHFLRLHGWSEAIRMPIQGDASTRAYERLKKPDQQAILMIAPRRPDGPPIRWGKPYSALAKLSESVHAFVAVAHGLREQGVSAPAILAADLEPGLLIVEDLGGQGIADSKGPIAERYGVATDLLAYLHHQTLPPRLPVAVGSAQKADDHVLPDYDLDALCIEVELLLDWYLPHHCQVSLGGASHNQFVALWRDVLTPLTQQSKTWTLRDYHSPNLLWLPEREGIKRIGVIDFQDAVLGHPAYDLVSLLQDARLLVSEDLELELLRRYLTARKSQNETFDMVEFMAAYAALGAQRATKILGIFIRLDRRDGKPDYLRHLPHLEVYLRRNLRHPSLGELSKWFQTTLPQLVGAQ